MPASKGLMIAIVVLAVAAVVIALPTGASLFEGSRSAPGTHVILEATNCAEENFATRLEETRQIIERRVEGLGIAQSTVRIQGDCQIVIELPPMDDAAAAIDVIRQSGRLELIDANADSYPSGTIIRTTGNPSPTLPSAVTPISPTETLSPTIPGGQTTLPDKVYPVVISGADLDPNKLSVGLGGVGNNQPEVRFTLQGNAVQTFGQFTAQHNETTNDGRPYYVCIVLDNVVQSCPSVRTHIPDGQGVITVGSGGVDEASRLVSLLRYGALPIQLQVSEIASLSISSSDSVRTAVFVGLISLLVIALLVLFIQQRRPHLSE